MTDAEVLERALGLRAPQDIRSYVNLSETVGFFPDGHRHSLKGCHLTAPDNAWTLRNYRWTQCS
jgi:hypothetical protein